MANFPGTISASIIWNDGGVLDPSHGFLDVPTWVEGYKISISVFGTSIDTQPIDEIPSTHTGLISEMYAMLHWYNRIHIQYTILNLGNVVGDQEIDFWILNTFLTPQELTDVIETGVEGLDLIEPEATPFDIQPLEELVYTLLIDSSGPPTITAEFEFVLPGFQNLTLTVSGVRVVGWQWEPNWKDGVRERLTWVSDGEDSYNGTPQRIQLREYPIQDIEFLVDLDGRRARTLENALYAWSGRTWAVPYPPDVEVLEVELPSGTESVLLPTGTKSYEIDGLAMFIDPDNNFYETAEIESITSGALNFKRGLARTWPIGTRVYPVVFCRMTNGLQVARFLKNATYAQVAFQSNKGRPYEIAAEPVYRGYPVLIRQPEYNTDPTQGYLDLLDKLENAFGESFYDKKTDTPYTLQGWTWRSFGREEIDELKKFLYARRGKVRAIWVPTYAEDLLLTTNLASNGTTLEVEHAGLVQFVADGAINRRDIRIELSNGQVFYRRVSDFTPVDDYRESFSIDAELGTLVTPDMVVNISWMHLVRLDSDTVELSWTSPQIMETSLLFRGTRDDL